MKNFEQPGLVQTFIAPVGGVLSGNAYQIGAALCIAAVDAVAGAEFEGQIRGVFRVPKASGAWTAKALIYWDNTAKNFTTTVGTNRIAGWADDAAASGDATAQVYLDGVAR